MAGRNRRARRGVRERERGDGLSSQQNAPREEKRGAIVAALAVCESVRGSFYEPLLWLPASSQPRKGRKTTSKSWAASPPSAHDMQEQAEDKFSRWQSFPGGARNPRRGLPPACLCRSIQCFSLFFLVYYGGLEMGVGVGVLGGTHTQSNLTFLSCPLPCPMVTELKL